MKRQIGLIFFLISTTLLQFVYADQFQIIEKKSGNPMGYVRVVFENSDFFADSRGRVSIAWASGSYPMKVYKGNDYSTVKVQIDNSNYLKKLFVD